MLMVTMLMVAMLMVAMLMVAMLMVAMPMVAMLMVAMLMLAMLMVAMLMVAMQVARKMEETRGKSPSSMNSTSAQTPHTPTTGCCAPDFGDPRLQLQLPMGNQKRVMGGPVLNDFSMRSTTSSNALQHRTRALKLVRRLGPTLSSS